MSKFFVSPSEKGTILKGDKYHAQEANSRVFCFVFVYS